jgi:S-adenosylmethionine hydrolase
VRPVIALLSDFGTADSYVGTMKGVIVGICPEANLVDITHEVPAHDVLDGALQLGAAFSWFPAGTIFLAVVDPGVGSARRAIVADTGEHRFVAPDNGLLTLVFRDAPPLRVVELSEPRYARATISRTFEGRDRFAPAAAWLADGVELSALGPPVTGYHLLDVPVPHAGGDVLGGAILRADRFGNLITNLPRRMVEDFASGRSLEIAAGGREIQRLVSTYADIEPGEICALFGSSDHLELAALRRSAAAMLGIACGATVELRRR